MFRQNRVAGIAALVVLVVVLGSLGYYALFQGQESFLKCVYMTVISLTTVGYGEVIDVSSRPLAIIYTMVLIISGMGILVYAASSLTAFIVEGQFTGLLRRKRMQNQINKLSGHCIVCGAGETGLRVVEELLKNLNRVVAVDVDPQRLSLLETVADAAEHRGHGDGGGLFFLNGDATDDQVLDNAGITKASGLVAALPSDKENLYITMSARMLNPTLRIVSKYVDIGIEPKLRKAGANSVVSPTLIGGLRIASEMIRPSAVDFLDKMIRSARGTLRIEEIAVREDSKLAGKKLGEYDLPKKYDLMVLALERTRGATMEFNPDPETSLEPGMILVVMGEVRDIKRARQS